MFQIQAAPSPRMVSWRTWPAPRRMPSASTRSGEHGGGLERGHIAGGAPVPDRVSLAVDLVLGEEDGELDLAGAGAAVFPLPSRPAVSFAVTGTPVPSIAAYSLSGSGDGGSGTSLRAVIMAALSRTARPPRRRWPRLPARRA